MNRKTALHSYPLTTDRAVPARVRRYAPKGQEPVAIVGLCWSIHTATAYFYEVPERFGLRHDVYVTSADRTAWTLTSDPYDEDGAVSAGALADIRSLLS